MKYRVNDFLCYTKAFYLALICSLIVPLSETPGQSDNKSALIQNNKKEQKFFETLIDELEKLYSSNDLPGANTKGRIVLKLIEKSPSPHFVSKFKVYSFLAANYVKQDREDSAVFFFQRGNELSGISHELTEKIPDYVCAHWGNQGVFYRDKANFIQSVNCINKAIQIVDQYRLKRYRPILLNNLANSYDLMGNSKKALTLYKQIERLGLPEDIQQVYILSSMGWNSLRLKQNTSAAFYFKKSLKFYRKLLRKKAISEDSELETRLLYHIGLCESRTKSYQQSNLFLTNGINAQLSKGLLKGRYLALCYDRKARNAGENGQISEALSFIQQGLMAVVLNFDDLNPKKNPELSQINLGQQTLFQLLAFKGKLLFQLYEKTHNEELLKSSVKTFQLAVMLADNYRKEIDFQDDKVYFTQSNTTVFHEAIEVTYQWYIKSPSREKATILFELIESNKAVSLNDFVERYKTEEPKIPGDLLSNEKKEMAINAGLRQMILQNAGREKTDSLKKLLTDSELRLYQIKATISKHLPFNIYRNTEKTFLLKELTALLSKETAYLSYTFTDSGNLLVMGLSSKSFIIRKIPVSKEFYDEVSGLIPKLHTNPIFQGYLGNKEGIRLYNYLIKPIEHFLAGTERLIICRDGALNYLPFEVLETGKKKDDYLINHYAVTYVYSGLSYVLRHENETTSKNRLLTMVPFNHQRITAEGDTLKALRTSEQIKKMSHRWISDKMATKEAFIQNIKENNLLNLVVHSDMDPSDPANSYVYFYPDSKKEKWKLGFYESLSLPLQNCKLLEISSCNSANGQFEANEGLISLTYAFTRAGCRSVVGAQWKAHDRSSAYISGLFFEYLNKGFPKDIALQKAKVDFIQSSVGLDLDHPFYWANLILTGSNQPIADKDGLPVWLIVLITLMLISSAILLRVRFFTGKAKSE